MKTGDRDREPALAWSPGFSRWSALPAEARTPCQGRFMKREHLQNLDVSWGHEPLFVLVLVLVLRARIVVKFEDEDEDEGRARLGSRKSGPRAPID